MEEHQINQEAARRTRRSHKGDCPENRDLFSAGIEPAFSGRIPFPTRSKICGIEKYNPENYFSGGISVVY